MAKTREEIPDRRSPGPKNRRSVIPSTFQISRPVSPMRQILDEAEGTTRPSRDSTPSRPSSESTESIAVAEPALIPQNTDNLQDEPETLPRLSRPSSPPTLSTESRPSNAGEVLASQRT